MALTWPGPAHALGPALADTTFTVNATDDPGDGACTTTHCSLREAIEAANAKAGTDTIAFDIDGIAPYTIQLSAALPTISDPLVMDGTTEPDFTIRPVVQLDGTKAVGAAGLRITAGSSTVRGLVVKNFADGIRLESNGGNVVEGNIIGTDFRLLDCEGNSGAGIWLDSPNNTIGGTMQTAPNIVVCNGSDGIYITGGSGNVLKRNYVGTDDARTQSLPNARDGVRIVDASGTSVGGTGPLDGNYLFYNGGAGLSLRGANATGNSVAGNTIAENDGDGVELPDTGTGNRISGNSIYANGGLGIDLGADGVTPNDPGDTDTGPNDLQNYPDITAAVALVGQIYIEGALSSRSSTGYDLEYFKGEACNASGYGDGRTPLGGSSVTTGSGGTTDVQATLNENVLPGDVISSTATDPDGSTSEFSACVVASSFALALSPDSVVVTRGSEAKYAVDLTAVGGSFDLPVQLDCSGLPGLTECSFEPATLTPGTSARSILTVTTSAPTGSAAASASFADARAAGGPGVFPGLPVEMEGRALALWLSLLGAAVIGLALIRPRWRTMGSGYVGRDMCRAGHRRAGSGSTGNPGSRLAAPVAVVCLGLAFFAGCGDDGGTGPTDGGTPTGRHEFTVTATAGPLERSETGLLIVR